MKRRLRSAVRELSKQIDNRYDLIVVGLIDADRTTFCSLKEDLSVQIPKVYARWDEK